MRSDAFIGSFKVQFLLPSMSVLNTVQILLHIFKNCISTPKGNNNNNYYNILLLLNNNYNIILGAVDGTRTRKLMVYRVSCCAFVPYLSTPRPSNMLFMNAVLEHHYLHL